MSGVVLAVGALMLVAGGYEMFAGNGDILSERGWSAFIAGSVLVAGGVVTMAIGLAVRAVEQVRGAILSNLMALGGAMAYEEQAEPVALAATATPLAAQADLFHEPTFEQAPTAPALAVASIEHALEHEPPPAAATLHADPELAKPAGVAAPLHDDWLDHSFADLEREMTVRHEPEALAPTVHSEPVAAAVELEPEPEPHSANAAPEAHLAGSVAHDAQAPHAADLEPTPTSATNDQATVSAREAPAASAIIGRYESEGTSYVMYADGSIDAQSDAGVYRFASMAELKTFIES